MEEYAKCDTRYLRELATILQTKLKSKRRLSWLRETCERLIEDCAQPVVVNSETCWRLKGHDKLSRLGLAILRELYHWREKEAISARKPPFFVLPHDLLVRISELRSNSSSKSAVQEVQQRLPRNFSPRRRREVQEAINQALRLPASELPPRRLPRPAPLPEVDQDLFEDFRKRRDAQAEKWGIDPSLIASKATLMNLARDSEEPLHRLMDWQSKALGLK
jgi:ribonuclease D